jgi:hypothetical protein
MERGERPGEIEQLELRKDVKRDLALHGAKRGIFVIFATTMIP